MEIDINNINKNHTFCLLLCISSSFPIDRSSLTVRIESRDELDIDNIFRIKKKIKKISLNFNFLDV